MSSSFWPLEATKGQAGPAAPRRAPGTSPKPSEPPAAAPHSQVSSKRSPIAERLTHTLSPDWWVPGPRGGIKHRAFLSGRSRRRCVSPCQRRQRPRREAATLSWRLRQCRLPSAGIFPTPKRLLFYPSGVAALSWLHSAVPGKNGVRSWGKTSARFSAGGHIAFQP